MIISKDTNPENDIYYLGAELISILDSYRDNDVDFFDAYFKMKNKFDISLNLYSLVVDWLFLLGIVESNKSFLVKCF